MNFEQINNAELMELNGGSGLEILIGGVVITGAPAWGIVGLGVAGLAGIAALSYYVASKN